MQEITMQLRPALLSLIVLTALSGVLAGIRSASANSATPPQNEIPVQLFGQPCVLRGPLEKAALKAIHSISPDQMGPTEEEMSGPTPRLEDLKKAATALKGASPIPPLLDRYRERLSRRLDAQIAFAEGMQAAQRTQSASPLLTATKPYLQTAVSAHGGRAKKTSQQFETLARKIFTATASRSKASGQSEAQSLYDLYSESIESDPEEDFHRAIRRLNIRYHCNFGDPEEE